MSDVGMTETPPRTLGADSRYRLLRTWVPRSLRNWVRHPAAEAAWWWREVLAGCGLTSRCRIRPDWDVRCHPSSREAFEYFAATPDCRQELEGFVLRCTPGMVLFDVGAHHGLYTLAALRYGGPAARVVALEPSAVCRRILWTNLRLAGGEPAVSVLGVAAGNVGGELAMLTTGASQSHHLVASPARPDSTRVEQVTLDALAARSPAGPTHLKIDVEGYEGEVIEGAQTLLRERRPVLFLELHGAFLRQRGSSARAVLDLLAGCGYRSWESDGRPVTTDEAAAADLCRLVGTPAL